LATTVIIPPTSSRFENVQYVEVSVMELERSRNKIEVIILACLEKPDFA
jgi:hypothetical protein